MANQATGQTAVWVAIGIAIGAALGVGFHNMVIGLVVGVIFGFAIAQIARRCQATAAARAPIQRTCSPRLR